MVEFDDVLVVQLMVAVEVVVAIVRFEIMKADDDIEIGEAADGDGIAVIVVWMSAFSAARVRGPTAP